MSHDKNRRSFLLVLQAKVFNTRFFTISFFLHLVLIISFGGTVLYRRISEPPDFTGGDPAGFVAAESAPAPPASDMPLNSQPALTVPTAPNSSSVAITALSVPAQTTFQMPSIAAPVLPTSSFARAAAPPPPPTIANGALTMQQAREISAFTQNWARKGAGGAGNSIKSREFDFTAYLAKYGDPTDPFRGGDWASCNWVSNVRGEEVISGGSLPNLLYLINKLSRDRIHAQPQPIPLNLSSQDIFTKKPPFIFFTGHRNFVLTDQELENLQKYVRMGGCIWGDSSLPGRRSRFDIAFRREMRRVIPDADKDWEQLPPTHPLFTTNLYYPEINKPPPGMNYYQEPVYALKYAGEVAVIYTSNDYGDMWQIGLTSTLEPDLSKDEHGRYVAINFAMWRDRQSYFRGVDAGSVFKAYQFGTNVIIHLLTRWEDRLKTVPTGR